MGAIDGRALEGVRGVLSDGLYGIDSLACRRWLPAEAGWTLLHLRNV